jgi:gliding motility-associated-like protein
MLSDLAKYPVLDAIYPYPTIPYVSSGKSFGDMTDLSGDQLFSFLNGTCETKSVSGNGPVCAGDTIHLTASGGDYYRWTGPSGFLSAEQNPSIYGALPAMSGLYSVLVASKNGCPSATKTIYITVNDLPVAAAMSPGTVCNGEKISFSATGGDTYSWTGPSGFTSRLQSPSFLHADLTMTGIYSVDVTDAHGCMATATTNLIVHPLPVALITGKNSICAGDTIILMAGGGEDFLWSGPTGFISSGTARSIAIMNADVSMTGIYKVIVTDQNGCRADTSTEITVYPVPDVNIEVEKDSICEGDHISVKGTPDGGIFHVRKGPGTLSENRLNSTGPGVIELEYTVTGICIGSSIRSITVNDKPVAFAGDNQYLNFVFNARMSASLNYGETGKWFSKNSSCKIPDFTSPTAEVTGLSVGENVFTWKVDNGFCTDSSGININVDDLFIPSVITPDNNGKNDFFQINSLNDHTVLMIFDSWGNLEYRNARYKNDWNGKNMKGEQLPADTYFYILDHGDGVIRKGTILIVR